MNLGIVTPELSHYGGSEVYLLECLRRWQDVMEVTLYTPLYRRSSASELDVLLHLSETIDSSASIDRLVTNSRTTGDYLRTIYGRAPDRVVYPGVNLPATV